MTLWEFMLSIFWFMLLFAWIWLLIMIISDVFRDHELSGWSKALWTVFLVFIPWLGALVYLIARGGSMQERAMAHEARNMADLRRYVQTAAPASAPSPADELAKLVDLRDRGAISPEDFDRAKALVLGERHASTV
ncbi:MAG TPA: SHOCT domain-containing protein [Actinophytocola sp.]|uniref:SHOCT domain-containing protein n=1 Tax=Actinophytocola sp. TaxID=1872138 RepID=UPI002DC056EF|nr:SHOCT domain-containing protein [Actinophytocola sp.]HEU5474464.1 SHOCT domain-containing protein [Actinophytocola sp.]